MTTIISLALFALIGTKLAMGVAYWILFSFLCLLAIIKIVANAIKRGD